MSVSSTSTFEQTIPHRPGESDLLNGTKTNATPVVPPHMPAAEEFTQFARQLEQLAKMSPIIRISIAFSGSTPSINSVVCVRNDILSANFTVTDNGVGDTSITWPASTFPASNTQPMATLNGGAVGAHAAPDVVAISNGVRVRTFDVDTSAADVPFTVEVF